MYRTRFNHCIALYSAAALWEIAIFMNIHSHRICHYFGSLDCLNIEVKNKMLSKLRICDIDHEYKMSEKDKIIVLIIYENDKWKCPAMLYHEIT